MRTRRSWRNQDRLWRYLGGQQPETPKVDEVTRLETILSRPDIMSHTRRQLERDLQRAKVRRAIQLSQ